MSNQVCAVLADTAVRADVSARAVDDEEREMITNSKLLVKMQNEEGSLERVIAKVRESHFQVRNLSARLSLDESLFFLTLEVEGHEEATSLTSTIGELDEVQAIELAKSFA